MSAKYSRWQTASILEALKVRRVVMLAGARQCGKTTLVKQLDHTAIYRTLDNQVLLDAAKTDPMGFIQHGNELMIVDEIQRAPILLPAIKMNVDENTAYGRFLITGSAKIQSLPTVNESLAGRIRKIRLRTLTQGEINNAAPRFLQQAFTEEFNNNYTTVSKDDCINYALVGGYPEAVFLNNLADAKQWYLDYVQSLLERDLKDIINIRRTDSIKKLLYVLAAWSSKYMDFAAIGSGLALSRPTIQSYINALEGLYLVEKIPAWYNTDYDRVGKQDKFFVTDTGLMSALLGYKFEDVRFDGDQNGKLLETFAYSQLAAQIDIANNEYKIFHYRDRAKREIDFIIENESNSILGIEIKAGSVVDNNCFKHLHWFKENLARKANFIGIVLYTGDVTLRFGEKMWAVPISILWS